VSPVLVGRDAELAAAVSAIAAPPSLVVVEGEAGVGKTRLVTELLAAPEVAALHRLSGRCHPIRESFPLGPVVEAVRGLGGALRGVRLSAVAGTLRPLVPELGDLLPPAPDPLDDRGAERHRVFRGLVDVLAALGPCVLAMEDLHWADEQTLDFLAYLISGLQPAELAVVVTYRVEDAGRVVRGMSARPAAGITSARVWLPPLDDALTGRLAAAILGIESVSAEFAAYLWERTAGLPLAIEEVLAVVRARGLLVQREGRWERRALDRLEVPSGIRDQTLERVGRLPAPARRLAEAAAVLQVAVEPDVVAAVSGVDSVSAIEAALESGVLVEQDHRIGFRHLLAAQAAYEDLSGPRRRALHGRAADVLQTLEPAPLGQVAHHLRLAERQEEWARVAEQAADRAVELAHEQEAARLLEDVLRTARLEPERRGRLALKLARAANETLQAREAVVDLLSPVLELELPRPVRGELRLLLALLLTQFSDDFAAQLRLFEAAIDDLEDRPDLRVRALVALGVASPRTVPLAQDLSVLKHAAELCAEIPDPQLETWVLSKLGMSLITFGDPSWRGLVDRVVELTGGSPRTAREVNAYDSLSWAASFAGQPDVAERLLNAALAAPVVEESSRLQITLRFSSALLAHCRGEWDGLADEVAALSGSLLSEGGLDVRLVAGCLALAHGDVDDARSRLSDVLDVADRLDEYAVVAMAAAAAARAALFRDDVEDALDAVQRGLTLLETKATWAPIGRLLPAAADALVAASRHTEARDLIDRAERELRGLDVPLAPAALRNARGVLASSPQDFLAAAEHYEAAGAPYEAAQARERAAACALERGEDRSATTPLQSATAAYERLGATWDRGRAASLARRHGIGPPRTHRRGRRGYGTELSPREREVAARAAAGRSNKEIAHELFISTRTVEKHLTAAMGKLGVRSRIELARGSG
jgi:DNA-binding CsgD family transcriptional regulator